MDMHYTPHNQDQGSPQNVVSTDLHVCGDCSSRLVFPTEWEPAGSSHWRVELRCPDCEWRGGGVFHQDMLDSFDRHLDRGTDMLIEDLKRFVRANMEEEVQRFSSALDANLILPEDF